MFEETCDNIFDEVFTGITRHLEERRSKDPSFKKEELKLLLKDQYVLQGNNQEGRSKPVETEIEATIAAYQQFLSKWDEF